VDDLVTWLRAQIHYDEQMALAASGRDEERPGEFAERWQWVHTGGPNPEYSGYAFVDQPVDLERWKDEVYVGGNGPSEAYRVSLRSLEQYPSSSGSLPHFVIGETEELEVATARHIAEHDPARVLREVEAKRQIVDLCADMLWHDDRGPDYVSNGTLWLLALPYADRPGYRGEEWKPYER
jgi:hypothetical protein